MSTVLVSHRKLVDELLAKSRQHLPNDVYQLFSKFISQYYLQVDPELLSEFSHDYLYAMAWSHWGLLQQRKEKTVKLRVFNPTDDTEGFGSAYTVIQLSIDNMPFLVDSMRLAILEIGYDINLMVHTGGLPFERDRRGRVKSIKDYSLADQDKFNEAPIAFLINRLSEQDELEQLRLSLEHVLLDVTYAVDDWGVMQEEMHDCIRQLKAEHPVLSRAVLDESAEFLQWLLDDYFIFLGCVDYNVVEESTGRVVEFSHNSGLGIFHDDVPINRLAYADMTEKARELAQSNEVVVIVCKSDLKSTVHRAVDMDLIVIKQFNKKGEHIGERQFYGLFSSSFYIADPRKIPLLSGKVTAVLERLDVPPVSYSGKNLKYILSTLPRDALFESSINELAALAQGILQLQECQCLRLFTYRNVFGKILSCLIFLPRDHFNTELIYKMQSALEKHYGASDSSFTTDFGRSEFARVHYQLHIDPHQMVEGDLKQIEAELAKMSRTWQDDLYAKLTAACAVVERTRLWRMYAYAFPAGYREDFAPESAVLDIRKIESLTESKRLGMSFYARQQDSLSMRLKFFHANETVPLSDALPMFENMGVRVIGEHPYEITLKDGRVFWINDFNLQYKFPDDADMQHFGELLKDTIAAMWYGYAEDDGFNRLVLSAQLTWSQVVVFRAYARYMRQIGFTYSQQYIEDTLTSYPHIVKMIFNYFAMRFNFKNPTSDTEREEYVALISEQIDQVISLDEDKILRRYLELIDATLRINFYQNRFQSGEVNYLAIKLASTMISDLPLPAPKFELYVYSPQFEGIHLRASNVARGGIRWSDRREDFRTEVLGLMKAQRVKNAVIVPRGAKGGYVVKTAFAAGERDAFVKEGISCYKQFISGLLDLTDNIIDGQIIAPPDVICYDDADAYLVVAADKGTATFSDIANQIAEGRDFWLGDAFASGGSAGYDHKGMGITARGAWVAAEEHFRNMGIDLQHAPVKVVAIGDMSGDVFGNGMLLSDQVELVAAFNHMHIFIDPNPNAKKSFRERKRLFALARSSWDDYDRGLISTGGGVYKRSAKVVELTPEVRELLETDQEHMTPDELVQAILCAQVDMLWNGGVGTFVKASHESHADAGDRANDALRVDGKSLRCKVVCEGGNLGLTQLARVEYALHGGLINTDFIDNSAGVDCSDYEVNIKIMLQQVLRDGSLDLKQRNELLVSMTDEVKHLVLLHNAQQARAITINTAQALHYFNLYQRYMQYLAQQGRINLEVENLPSEAELMERLSDGIGMMRPEIAVLFSYGKIDVKEQLLASDLLQQTFFDSYLRDAFPQVLLEKYHDYIMQHRLRNEIIATQLTNHCVADMGFSFIYQMQDETNADVSDVVRAYVIAKHVFEQKDIFCRIDELNHLVSNEVQHKMYISIASLIRRSTRWLLRQKQNYQDIPQAIAKLQAPVSELQKRLSKLLLGTSKDDYDAENERLLDLGVPAELAGRVAGVRAMYHAWNIVVLSLDSDVELFRVAKIYFTVADRFDLFWFREQIDAYPSDTRWAVLAKASYKGDLDKIQRNLISVILDLDTKAKSIPGRLRVWMEQKQDNIERWKSVLAAMRSMDVKDFAILSIAIRELKDLAALS